MNEWFARLSGLRRQRIVYWLFNLVMALALLAFSLRGWLIG